MRRNIPPLNALRVFEIAGRTENFSKAAEELCITQSAVSKQIRILEENLNEQLFSRKAGIVTLTAAGEDLLDTVVHALDKIETGTETFYREKKRENLAIDITPSMSAYWMFEHIESFNDRFPNISLYIDSNASEVNWVKNNAHLAIRILQRDRSHQNAELLLNESLMLVATKEVLQKFPIKQFEDILKHRLIANNSRPLQWENFCMKFNLNTNNLNKKLGCEHTYMTINAALQGLGLALAPRLLCERFLENGQLINPLGIEIDSGRGYFFLAPPHKRDERKVRIFRDWIISKLNTKKTTLTSI